MLQGHKAIKFRVLKSYETSTCQGRQQWPHAVPGTSAGKHACEARSCFSMMLGSMLQNTNELNQSVSTATAQALSICFWNMRTASPSITSKPYTVSICSLATRATRPSLPLVVEAQVPGINHYSLDHTRGRGKRLSRLSKERSRQSFGGHRPQ